MFHHHPHHDHVIKLLVTLGCFFSTFIVLINPQWQLHAGVIALSANIIWLWG